MSFLSDLLHHPRRLFLRRTLFQIHLWAGVLLSLYVILIALSGSILVYKDELTRLTLPANLHVYDPTHTASPALVIAQLDPAATLSTLQFPTPVLPAFLLEGRDPHGHRARWFADPATGTLHVAPRTWLDTVHDLHDNLLVPEPWGMQANGIGAAILLLIAATGLFLWWSGLRSWARGLRLNPRANWRRLNYDLHSAIGFWTLALVLWWALSGVYFGFYRQVTAAVAWVSPLHGMISPAPARLPPAPPGSHASLQQILNSAQLASPGRLWSVSDPALRTPDSFVLLDRAAPGDFSHCDIVRIRTADARLLSIWHYGDRHSVGDWILWSMHPLHFGTTWGPVVKLLWCLLGLSLAALTVTGLLMYWNRFLRKLFPAR